MRLINGNPPQNFTHILPTFYPYFVPGLSLHAIIVFCRHQRTIPFAILIFFTAENFHLPFKILPPLEKLSATSIVKDTFTSDMMLSIISTIKWTLTINLPKRSA